MSYRTWSRENFHRPLHVRAWNGICAHARTIRARWRNFLRSYFAWFEITL